MALFESANPRIHSEKYSVELAFTETYRRHIHDHPAIREARCLQSLMPHLFDPIRPGDLFAGRTHYLPIGFGLEDAAGGPVYYCYEDRIRPELEGLSEKELEPILGMLDFWKTESTIAGKLVSRLPEETRKATTNHIAEMMGRLSGTLLDYEKLTRIGLPGLRAEIAAGRKTNGDLPLYAGMDTAIDLLTEVIQSYASQACELAVSAKNEADLKDNFGLAAALEAIAIRPPETLREAAQLIWLFTMISGTVNYGRMDVYLGGFYCADVDSGRLTEAEALRLMQSLWQLIADRKTVFNGRVFIGGRGRPDETRADRFALLAMEATRTVIEIEPQLTLRFYEGMNPALMAKALDMLGEGRTFPMLFNDDVNIPAVRNGFGIPLAYAEQYLPYGCGEYCLDHLSFGSPNCSLNLLKALEAVLHHGVDVLTGEKIGLDQGDPECFATFDELFAAYRRQVEYSVEALADRHCLEYQVENEAAAFLYASMLYDDCIARGKSLVGGGVRIKGGLIETYGMVNAADSLTVIRSLVYDRKLLTLPQLVAALDADFAGFEKEYRLMRLAPKYGNDDPDADGMLCAVSEHVASHTRSQAKRLGFDYFLIVNINNHMNIGLGAQTGASAEGRRSGAPLANGNTPTAGNDTQGVTAFLNSIVKPDVGLHAGYTHNMKFSKSTFREERPKVEALLKAYFANGGAQAMITVVGRGDMEAAINEPEKYRNLIVRVGGFSARFIELTPAIQRDLIARTLY
ncbi:MAG TPA: pyruvate formate lyase family protein [Anaerolineales bacterium]|nr:pyruvate formate lyase family protein [Anaerolineales bacterium]